MASIFDKLGSQPKALEAKEPEKPKEHPLKRNFALWRSPKVPAKFSAEGDVEGITVGRNGAAGWLRGVTRDGQELMEIMLAIARGEPYPSELIQDELGRPRLNESGEVCFKWSLPSQRVQTAAIEWLSRRGVVMAAPVVSVVQSTSTYRHSDLNTEGLSVEEMRVLARALVKSGRALPSPSAAREDEVDGEVVDPEAEE